MKTRLIFGALVLGILGACGGDSGGEYIGKWVNVRVVDRVLVIERNGPNFIVRETALSPMDGKMETRSIPATLKNGMLQVQVGGFGAITLSIDRASGNLTDGESEYKRAG